MSWTSREQGAGGETVLEGKVDAKRPASLRGGLGWGLAKIGSFLLLVAILGSGLDRLTSAMLRNISTGEQGVWNAIVQGRINADVLISGSSRAMSHYDSLVLQEELGQFTYNIGLNGSQTDMQVARLKTYLRHNRPPKLLIHNLDAFSFQVTHGEVYDPGQYLPLLAEDDLYSTLVKINPETWKWRYIPLYGYATQDLRLGWLFGMLSLVTGESSETHFQGFKPRDDEWREDFENFRARNPDGYEVSIEASGVEQMEQLLETAALHGIKVVLVYSPEFAEVQAMTRNRPEIVARFRALSAKHGAVFLDFSASSISSNRSWFFNSQHLNAGGARLFTRELADRLTAEAPIAGLRR